MDRVHSRVVEVMTNLLLDVESVKQMVAGLGGFASVVSPGIDFDSALGAARGRAQAAISEAKAQAAVNTTALTAEVEKLETALSALGRTLTPSET